MMKDVHVESKHDFPLVSIYTCVYNGERTIHRVFDSIKKISYPNIEHVIINDGSTDNTESLVLEYIKQVDYPVVYFAKENGGKHTALNKAWDIANGVFLIQLDADDELLPHSISFLVDTYFSIPEDIRDNYWCVHGRCVTQNGDFVGDPYPEDINNSNWREAGQKASRCAGEKIGLQVKKYLSCYKFPEVIGAHFLQEGIIWKQINSKYGTWYTNEVVRVYYVNEGGNLSAMRTKRMQFGSLAYYYKWKFMHPELYKTSLKDILMYSLCFFTSSKKYRKHNGYFSGLSKYAPILAILAPVMFVGSIVLRIVRKIK